MSVRIWAWLAMTMTSVAVWGCATENLLRPAGGFIQPLGRAHPLVGRVWDSARGEFSAPSALRSALMRGQLVVLGETHDNRDHHLLQAQLLRHFATTHVQTAVAFEMLDEDQAQALAAHEPVSVDALAQQVQWSASGWPAFELYRPVFDTVLAVRARLIAAHPSREHVRESMTGLSPEQAHALGLDVPLPAAQLQAQRDEIRASHCGHANDAMVKAMELAQSYKDAFMARAMLQTRRATVLIAGRGHARNDRGVPLFLRRMGKKSTLSVALVDVDDAHLRPQDYGRDLAAFDFVVFTPRVTDEDPCQRFKQQLQTMQRHTTPIAAP
jgi:uncharacterized iron-regulated protein